MIKMRTKIEIVGVIFLALSISLASVFAVTRTITDESDTVDTYIRNSNGKYWEATASNLQDAIDDLNNVSGWVLLPDCDITLTTYLRVGTGCHLMGGGNCSVLRLGTGANTTVIRNYDMTNGNDNLKFSDFRIEGNSGGQDVYYDAWYAYRCGIWVKNCDYVEISGIFVNGTSNQGVLADKCRFVDTHDCMFTDLGIGFDGSGLAHYAAEGVYYYNTTDSVISNCIVDNAFSVGFVVEGYITAPVAFRTKNVTVSNCVVTDTGIGYYCEDAEYIMFTGCTVSCGTDNSCFGANTAKGFQISFDVQNIIISGCIVQDTYRGMGLVSGKYITVKGCVINDTTSYGIEFSGSHSIISNNRLSYMGNNGIVSTGHNNTIIGNYIYHAGQWAAGIAISGSKNQTVMFNHIVGTGTQYPNIGVYGANTDSGGTVLFNNCRGMTNKIYQVKSKVNCSDASGNLNDDWNFYVGVT